VELPYGADYLYKLRTLQAILDSGKIESNEVGTIRMTGDGGQNVFIKD
jgi:cell division protein FtsQ